MPQSGDVLADRYRLIEPLGQGGMGTVWRAEHLALGSHVAIKLIDEKLASSDDTLARFKREAKAAASLTSTHVVQIFDYGIDCGVPFIAMELLDGESLAQRLKRLGRLTPEHTARILRHVAIAMDKAHRAGIVHRDLKPDNIFILTSEDEEEIVKVLDFGVAKALNPDPAGGVSSHTRTGALVGSPYYMSPEQARSAKSTDHRSDIWSLGVITYECLLGERPFQGEALGDLVVHICADPMPIPSEHGQVPPGFDEWFAKACSRDLEERFSSAKRLVKTFRLMIGQTISDEESVELDAESHRGLIDAEAATAVQTAPGLARSQTEDERHQTGQSQRSSVKTVGIAFAAAAIAGGVAVIAMTGGEQEPNSDSAAAEKTVDTKTAPTQRASVGQRTSPAATAKATTHPAATTLDAGAGTDADGGARQAEPPKMAKKPLYRSTPKPTSQPLPTTTSKPVVTATPSSSRNYGF